MAVLMEEGLERNLDNLLRFPHSTGDYVLREGWSSTLKIVTRIQIDFLSKNEFLTGKLQVLSLGVRRHSEKTPSSERSDRWGMKAKPRS